MLARTQFHPDFHRCSRPLQHPFLAKASPAATTIPPLIHAAKRSLAAKAAASH
jgi:hypothetical protein